MNVRARHRRLDATADVDHGERAAGRQRARQRRREDQDARERPRRFVDAKETGPQLAEEPDAIEAWPGGDAEEPFDAATAERASLWELAWIEVEFGLDAEQ